MKNIIFSIALLITVSAGKVFAQVDTVRIQTSAECETCKIKIEKEMPYQKGVRYVNLDLDTKVATIAYMTGKTDPDKLRKAIAKLGYDADAVPADPKAYNRLDECCKKNMHK